VARLLIVAVDGSEREVELTERTVQIGRGPGNDIVLPDPHSGVSRTHAELRFRNGRCVIVDLHSQNGTFLNGDRIEHAEVPHGAEVTIGNYRLRLLSGPARAARAVLDPIDAPPPSTVGLGRPLNLPGTAELPDFPLVRRAPGEEMRATPAGSRTSRASMIGGIVIVAAVAVLVLVYAATPRQEPESPALEMPSTEPPTSAGAPGDPATSPTGTLPAKDVVPPESANAAAAPTSPPGSNGVRPAPSVRTGGQRFDGSLVARRPGESADAWRSRTAAFQTRYAYSRAALDRGDFAAAAGGFEAILQEEPGFLDVPQLLLRARAGLRDVARDVFEAGQRLDAAGDWLGALQKYEQASQIHPDVRGLPEAVKRVREKLRTAGEGAFNRARRFEESGRWADALKEFEKAVQWLPSDDPRWELAHNRVEQLKKSIR
jgi:FHA domain